ncbi:DivIVA domain-containing protein [Persicitalea jodogahamensis]|uniref:DivIVA domain-containing protein n=1 Tax=Persicitalea jodogahamensis TaxID=402147 RepID=A0A8J3DB94_9BACT|nr:DivIVA domain-containing protein [Persicitalea jodogahamensis]GHB71802.1 hypothetical protein GCM10007390_27140 [Persicitalea jodogahamensis]
MKISPIDIRQHTFEKGFRGYDIDDVNAFLNSLSQEWERVMNENKMLKMQLEIAEKELNKLRDVEMTLFRTLKTAEDTSTKITEQANKAAEKYLEESRRKTDETIAETRRKASMIVQDAENEAKYIREEIINELKNQERDFKAMEKYRDNLVVQLKSLVNNTNETVERFEKKFSEDSSFAQKMEGIKQQVTEAANKPTQAEIAKNEDNEDQTASEEEPVAEDAVHEAAEQAGEQAGEASVTASVDDLSEESAHSADDGADHRNDNHDAAADALAEVEKMANARRATQELEVDKGANDDQTAPEESSKSKGSFFDEIG